MISRKKRQRYKYSADLICKQHNISINLDSWVEVWDLLDRFKEPEYVYAVADVNGNIKFGKSVNPNQRLKTLQTSSANPLRLLTYCLNRSPLEEKEIHDSLKEYRLNGEWFRPSPEVNKVIGMMSMNYTSK